MKKTITINKIDGIEKRILSGENTQIIKGKILKQYPIIEAEICNNQNKPGQYWLGWGAFKQDIVSVSFNI